MECVANYEIKTECSIVADDLVLRIKHPEGLYRARIQNIPRSVYITPFLLSLHLYFNSPTLDEALDIADGLLADCLNSHLAKALIFRDFPSDIAIASTVIQYRALGL